jgi:lipopolysaccharide heptosyltransferase I
MKIALLRLSSLGDVVHALPVAAALRAHRPGVHITWVAERHEAALLRGHPALDAVVVADTRRWRRARRPPELLAALRDVRGVKRQLGRAGHDVALDLQGLVKSALLALATRAPLRVGFERRSCREPLSALATNRRVAPPAARHVVEQNLSLLGPLGIVEPPARFELPVDPDAEARVDDLFGRAGLKPTDPLVVLNPGAGRPLKRWPPDRFRQLADRLAAGTDARVLVLWGPGDRDVARQIVDGLPAGPVLLAPPTDLAGLVAVLRRARVVVAGDTGPLHLAAALGVRCVGLYGPTSEVRNGPYGPGHRVLVSPDRQVASLEVSRVFHAVAAGL